MNDDGINTWKTLAAAQQGKTVAVSITAGDLLNIYARLAAAEAVCDVAARSEDMFEEDLGQALAAWRRAAGKEPT